MTPSVPWSAEEDAILRAFWPTNETTAMLSERLGRTRSAIQRRAKALRLPTRRKFSKNGWAEDAVKPKWRPLETQLRDVPLEGSPREDIKRLEDAAACGRHLEDLRREYMPLGARR